MAALTLLLLMATLASPSVGYDPSTNRGIDNGTVLPLMVKLHGVLMTTGWGLVAPVGISIALLYKAVWPGKGWFFTHLFTMLTALLFNVAGIVLIVVHARGQWLSTQVLNLPHQVLGIVAISALGINPFVAILKPDPESKWRGLFNLVHGSIGVFLGICSAMAAMLLGVHMLPALTSATTDRLRIIVYLMSAVVGYVIFMISLFNIYPLRYHKGIPEPYRVISLARLVRMKEQEASFAPYKAAVEEEDELQLTSSPDAVCRVITSSLALIPLLGLVTVTITFLAML